MQYSLFQTPFLPTAFPRCSAEQVELALRSPGCARGHVSVLARESCICQLRFFHDFPPTSFTHFQSKHCIMQSTVPAGEGNWILFCVFSSQVVFLLVFFLICPELISPPRVLNGSSQWYLGCFSGKSRNSDFLFFQETRVLF